MFPSCRKNQIQKKREIFSFLNDLFPLASPYDSYNHLLVKGNCLFSVSIKNTGTVELIVKKVRVIEKVTTKKSLLENADIR